MIFPNLIITALLLWNNPPGEWLTPFEKGNGNQTTTYGECISYYQKLDSKFQEARLFAYGTSASGHPIHAMVISVSGIFDPAEIAQQGKAVLLISNGIHPGEPDGIDASMMAARDVLVNPAFRPLLANVVVVLLPVYNVSGMLRRNSTSRANQNGPEEYGFRGTAQNYDLNRDFAKCDTREAQTFAEIFHTWKPHIFVDTHVSNGADYPYTMTLIPTQKDKLHPLLASYQENILLPDLYAAMKSASFIKKDFMNEMIPYVNTVGSTPDGGLLAFLETPRYSTGYAALFNCIGMMPETHMLKPYSQRVWSTYQLLLSVLEITARDHRLILDNKAKADVSVAGRKEFAVAWSADMHHAVPLLFKGYTAKYKTSEVSGEQRLYYDRSDPYEKEIPYYNHYVPAVVVSKPYAYIVPQAWESVIERLKQNRVQLRYLSKDTVLHVNAYYIDAFRTTREPFEGHYLHSEVKVNMVKQLHPFYKGDCIVYTDQPVNRYILEMLEPQGTDSYFAWNFFDAVLTEKEYYSDYVFEDEAAEMLKNNPELKAAFEKKKMEDEEIFSDPNAQLYYLFMQSPHFEKSYRRYPVCRMEERTDLPLD